jgi:hypothetical protein
MTMTSSDIVVRALLDLSFRPGLGLTLPKPRSVTAENVQPPRTDIGLLFGSDVGGEPKGR